MPHSRRQFILLSGIFLAFCAAGLWSSLYWLILVPFMFLAFYLGWQYYSVTFFLLLFFLPWSVEYNFNSSLGTDFPDESLMWLITALVAARFVFKPGAVVASLKHPLVILLFIYYVWIATTVPFSTGWLVSIKFFFAKSWYIAAFVFTPLVIFKNKKSIQTAGLIFLISMLSVTAVSLARHAWLGFRFADVNAALSPFFRNHVNYSAMLVCTIPVLVALYQLNTKKRTVVILLAMIVSAALFFSYSRGAWLAALLGLFSYWLIRKRKFLMVFVICVILIPAYVYWIGHNDRYLKYANDYKTTIFHKNFEQHLIATYQLKDISTAERLNRWVAGVRMVGDKPIIGYGPNTFYDNYRPYTLPAFKTWVSDNKEHSTVHNYFLLITIEQGVPGLLFFLLLVGAMVYYSQTLYERIKDPFYKSVVLCCGVILMMILTVNFLSDLIESDKVGSLFFLCLAALVASDVNTRNDRPAR